MNPIAKFIAVMFVLVLTGGPAALAAENTPADAPAAGADWKNTARQVVDRTVAWYEKNQIPEGAWGKPPFHLGVTCLAVKGLVTTKGLKRDNPMIAKAVEFILKNVQPEGSIMVKGQGLANYNTSVAVMALAALNDPALAGVVEKSRKFLVGFQRSEENGYAPKDYKSYGGIGYSDNSGNADLTNLEFALSALQESNLPADSPVWKRAAMFLSRCQGRTESNDLVTLVEDKTSGVANDGGFGYSPGVSKAGKEKLADGRMAPKSYASMTYAGLKSFIYAKVDRKDPRVQAAYAWIQSHYSLDENIGMRTAEKPNLGKQGLYYYYHTFAKALQAYGEPEIKTTDGPARNWRKDLVEKLASLQKPDGFWVNDEDRWGESDPALASAYVLIALGVCLE